MRLRYLTLVGLKLTAMTSLRRIASLLSVLVLTVVNAQVLFETIPKQGWDGMYMIPHSARSVKQLPDGGYIIAGTYSCSYLCSTPSLIRTNALGQVIWSYNYEVLVPATNGEGAFTVELAQDGGFVVLGTSTPNGRSGALAFKVDRFGALEWSKTFGDAFTDVYANSAIATSDGGFVIGFTGPSVVKIDANGALLWSTRVYDGGLCYSMDETTNGDLIVADYGEVTHPVTQEMGLVRLNTNGDTLSTQRFGGPDCDHVYSVRATSDGGCIIAGSTKSFGAGLFDACLVKMDDQGAIQWSRTYGGAADDEGMRVVPTTNGGYLLAGTTQSVAGIGKSIYLVQVDALGDTLWTRAIGRSSNEETPYDVQQTADGGFIIVGASAVTYAGAGMYMIKTDSLGRTLCNDHSTNTVVGIASFVPSTTGYTLGTAFIENTCTMNAFVSGNPAPICLTAPPSLLTASPSTIAPIGYYTISILGTSLTEIEALRFSKSGSPDIIPDSIIIVDDTRIVAWLNLADTVALGSWDLHATFADTVEASLTQALNVAPYAAPGLTVNVSGASFLRIGSRQSVQATITNHGNVDAFFPLLLIGGLPPGTTLALATDSLISSHRILEMDTLGIDLDSLGTTALIDSVSNTGFGMFQPYRVPAGGSITVSVLIAIPDTSTAGRNYQVTAIVTAPLYTSLSPEASQRDGIDWSKCMLGIAELAMKILVGQVTEDFSDLAQCAASMYSWGSSAYSTIENLSESSKNTDLDDWIIMYNWTEIMGASLKVGLKCLEPLGTVIPVGRALKLTWKIYFDWASYGPALYNTVQDCMPEEAEDDNMPHTPHAPEESGRDSFATRTGNSSDPNEKVGPGSNSHTHYTNDGNLEYTIFFENDPSAELPAQTILVLDTLDATKLDLSTVRLHSISLGLRALIIDASPPSEHLIDLSAERGLLALVHTDLNPVSGVLSWSFLSLDTATSQVTQDPIVGILPPDTIPPLGQGAVSFSVRTYPGMHGSSIANSASIIFDSNAPIITPVWTCWIDTVPPQSTAHVTEPIVYTDSVLVSWSGTDDLSGIERFNVLYSFDSLNYVLWEVGTSSSERYFLHDTAHGDIVYFYALAVDSAGNIETAPNVHDARVMFQVDIATVASSAEVMPNGVVVFPNPTADELHILLPLPEESVKELMVYDALGRAMPFAQATTEADGMIHLDVRSLASGPYLIRIWAGDTSYLVRFLRN